MNLKPDELKALLIDKANFLVRRMEVFNDHSRGDYVFTRSQAIEHIERMLQIAKELP